MTLHEAVKAACEKKQNELIRVIVGGVKSHEEYRFLIGQLRGMVDLMDLIEPYLMSPEDIEDGN